MEKESLLIGGCTPKVIEEITEYLSDKRREDMKKMLPAFPFKDMKERDAFIVQSVISYSSGVADGIREYIRKSIIQDDKKVNSNGENTE
jgi:hypothetical protein